MGEIETGGDFREAKQRWGVGRLLVGWDKRKG